MDLRAYYIQAAAAAVHAAEDDDVPELTPNPKAMALRLEVQRTADAAASRQGSGVAPMGVGNAEDGKGGRDLTCPECGKTFLSVKAMYGHLRSHPERGYKGAARPTTASAAAAIAGDKKPRKPRKEAELSAMNMTAAAAAAVEKKPWDEPELSTKWPVKAKHGRAPSTPSAWSAPVAAAQSRCCNEEEEAAMILLEMAYGRSTSETQQLMQLLHAPEAISRHQMPDVAQPMLLDHVAGNQMVEVLQPIRPDHVACTVVGHQMPEAEQVVRAEHVPEVIAESQTPEVKELTKLELATEAVLVVVPANKKSKKQRLLDLQQTPAVPPPETADVKPPARRIPSPASDKKHECPTCGKSFPTYQALGGHMSSHTKGSKQYSARHDDLAAAQAMHNILAHNSQSGDVVVGSAGQERQDVQPPAPTAQGMEPHVCAECHLAFHSGQALGGHKRKHWFPEKQQARAARATAALRDFDLNELPKEGEGENQP